MDICKRAFCVVASCFISLVAFSGVSRSVSAVGGTTVLTPAETRDLVGQSISAQYYDGSDMVDFTFVYGGTTTIGSMLIDGSPTLTFDTGDTVVWYSAQINPNTNPQYITVDVRPQYSFFDTETVQQMVGLSCGTVPGVSVYSPPSWRWHTSYSGDLIVESQLTANTAYYAIFNASINGTQQHFTFVDVSLTQQATFSAYSNRALFYGNAAVSGYVYLILTCPTVSDTSTMASGTGGVTTAITGGTGDITVNVDMTETNTFLGGILDFLQGFLQGIAALFVPSHEDFLQWLDDLHTLLREHFGAFVDTMLIIDSVFDSIPSDPQEELYIQLPYDVTVPGVPMVFTMQDWTFELVPTGWAWLVDLLKDFGDILITIVFINMVRNRWEHFLDPDSPET